MRLFVLAGPMKPNRAELGNVLILATGQSLFTTTTITVMTLASVLGLQLSPDPRWATLPVAMMMGSTLLTTLPASLFMKQVGRRRGFILGATFGGAAGAALMLAGVTWTSFALFCAGMFLIGIYQSFAMYYRFAAADVAREEFRGSAVSYVLAGGVIAAVLGPLNARASIELIPSVPFGGPFLVITLLALLAAVLLTRLQIPLQATRQSKTGHDDVRPLLRIARHRGFLPAILASSVCFSLMVLSMTITPLGMQEQGFSMTAITLVVQSQVLAMFVPSFFTGLLIARFGLLPILWTGICFMAASMLIGATSTALPIYVASRIALGLGWNLMFIGGAVLLGYTHKASERGKVQGVNDLSMFALVTVLSITAAALLQQLGWSAVHLLSLLPVAIVALALLPVRKRHLTH